MPLLTTREFDPREISADTLNAQYRLDRAASPFEITLQTETWYTPPEGRNVDLLCNYTAVDYTNSPGSWTHKLSGVFVRAGFLRLPGREPANFALSLVVRGPIKIDEADVAGCSPDAIIVVPTDRMIGNLTLSHNISLPEQYFDS